MPKIEVGLTTGRYIDFARPERKILEDTDIADRMSNPPAGWGVLSPSGTAL